MTDIVDMAAQREADFLAESLAHFRQPETGGSLSHCEDCGDPIPEARQRAVRGCRRCIRCQELYEREARGL